MLDVLFLPLLLWVAGAAAWSDWRTGKIPNRLLLQGLFVGAQLLVVVGAWIVLGGPGQSSAMRHDGPFGYLGAVVLNGACAFALAFVLWWFGVWAAGDAKLFALLSLLVPHGFYERNLLVVFPSYVLLFNTFLCMIALLLLELGVRAARRLRAPGVTLALRTLLARAFAALRGQGPRLVRVVLGFAALFMAVRVARHYAREAVELVVRLDRTVLYVVLFLLFAPLSGWLARPRVFVATCAAIVAYAIWAFGLSDSEDARSALVQIGWSSVAIVAAGAAYSAYSRAAEVRTVRVGDVAPGLLLSEDYAARLRSDSTFNNERMGVQGPDGLTPLQVETLQTWHARHDAAGLDAPVELANTVPFAPSLLLAVLLTALFRGYLFVV